ncbi:MAG: hypothetical protein KDE27_25325 [Planctomycetes bacterium]|nr:hypothetical protein [Planctomycetota bacterium]
MQQSVLNGGSEACIVRVASKITPPSTSTFDMRVTRVRIHGSGRRIALAVE